MEAQDSGVGLQAKRSELKTWLGNCVVFLGNSRVHRAQPYNDTKQQQPFKPKKFGCTTVQGATLTCMVNCTAGTPMPWLCPVVQWSVHWAPSQTTHVLVMAGARRCTLETCGKKMRAPLLGLAKSVYYTLLLLTVPFSTQEYRWVPANCQGSLKNLAMNWHSIKGEVTVITPSDYVLRKLG